MGALTDEYENKIKSDCEQLYIVLKNCDAPGQSERDQESIKWLYRLVFLLSYRQGAKMMAITTTTASYLCHHPVLPVILVEILRDSKNIKICAYVLDVLAKLVLKNSVVGDTERKAIRKLFHEPHHFSTVILALRNMDTRFLQHLNKEENEEDSGEALDIQIRYLKIINCLYNRKGQTQIALLTEFTVEFLRQYFVKYARNNLEIGRCMLPLIKTICRNKKNCEIMCTEEFATVFVTLVPAVKKYPAGISILRLLSRSSEAINEMSRVEAMHHFVVHTAIFHAEKATHRKYLMSAMYRLGKTNSGMHLLQTSSLWSALFEFFMKSERFEELRQRMSFTRAYTILHRGVTNKFALEAPLVIDFDLAKDIQSYVYDRSNHQTSDDSDNDEEDEEEEHQINCRSRTVSVENEDEDIDESDNENDEEETDADNHELVKIKIEKEEDVHQDVDESDLSHCFVEFNENEMKNDETAKILKAQIQRHPIFDRLALPDLLPHLENDDDGFLTSSINTYSPDELSKKLISLKNNLTEAQPKIIYDLDELIKQESTDISIPNFEDVHLNYLNRQMAKRNNSASSLTFESRFECGNLRKVEQIGPYEYNLFISPDVNMTCGLQWFYFQVTGMLPLQTYAFNIVNLQKCNSQFSYGLQPVMFSTLDYAMNSKGWRKCGTQLMYHGNEYISRESNKQYRTLRFCISFDYEDDVCYFAYHFPYTYTRLMRIALAALTVLSDDVYVRIEELTKSVGGFNSIPLITITGRDTEQSALQDRKLVFLTSRVHPGESNASWIMEGAMRYLASNDERAITARENYVFKIIPILNPEGVIYGNTRCGLTGNDLNRCWKKPHPTLHPEIYNAKKLVQFAREHLKNEIFAFVDIHGHSRKKYFFLYGCNPRQSWNEADAILSDTLDVFNSIPNAMAEVNHNIKLSYCRHTVERKRETTCRVVMWREFAIPRSHTLECSFCSGENKKKITTGMLREVGEGIIKALANLALSPKNSA